MSVAQFPSYGEDRRAAEFDRTPPQDVSAEQCVLGGMLLSKDAIADVVEVVRSHDFYKPAHQLVYDATLDLYGRGEPADPVTVSAELTKRGEIGRAGGAPYLHTLISSVPTAANAGYYAKIVRERAVLRRLVEAGTKIVQLGYAADGSEVDDVVDRAQAEVYAVTERRTSEDYQPLAAIMEGALDEIEAIGSRGGAMVGVPTGFGDLDQLTNGLHPGQMVVIAARPALGKCLASSSMITEARTGERITVADLVRRGQAGESIAVHTLDERWRLQAVEPSDFIDNGVREVFRVTLRSGRSVRATANHPLRLLGGWAPLSQLQPGDRVAVPRRLEIDGSVEAGASEPPNALVGLVGYLLGDGNLTNLSPTLSATSPAIVDDATAMAADLGITAKPRAFRPCRDRQCADPIRQHRAGETGHRHPTGLAFTTPRGEVNPLTLALRDLGLLGLGSYDKHVPAAFFRLPRGQVALLVSRLFATDGWASVSSPRRRRPTSRRASVAVEVGYCSVSERLARDVQHLLLRLGVVADLRCKTVSYAGGRRTAWQVVVHSRHMIEMFCAEVGIWSKEDRLAEVEAVIDAGRTVAVTDSVPGEVWERVYKAKGCLPWAEVSARVGLPRNHNWHAAAGKDVGRGRLATVAAALGNVDLADLAHSDVYWDEVVAVEPDGMDRVYDLSIDGTHCFVADDVVVHNSTMGLDIARSASIRNGLASVLFSLEMSRNEITMRLLSAEAQIPLHRMRTGSMDDNDWTRLARKMGEVSSAPLFIDDSPNMSMMEIRAKCRRLKQRHDLRLVVIDYLQLMQSGKRVESRQQEVSEFSRALKLLAKELDVPVVAISQLNRGAEQRTDKKPQMSDLRESGSIEQDADMVILLHREDAYERESPRAGEADFIVAKHRNGPTATITVAFQGHYSRFVDMAHG